MSDYFPMWDRFDVNSMLKRLNSLLLASITVSECIVRATSPGKQRADAMKIQRILRGIILTGGQVVDSVVPLSSGPVPKRPKKSEKLSKKSSLAGKSAKDTPQD
jgi:hypothetical protein